jgi:hypothetical protein
LNIFGDNSPAHSYNCLERSVTNSSATSSVPSPIALPTNPKEWSFKFYINSEVEFFPKSIPFYISFLTALLDLLLIGLLIAPS